MKKLCWLIIGMLPILTAQADLRCISKTTTDEDLYRVAVKDSDGFEKSAGFGSTSPNPVKDALALCNALLIVTSCSDEGVLLIGGKSNEMFNVVQYLNSGSNTAYEFDNSDHERNFGSKMMCQRSRARLIMDGVENLSRKLKAGQTMKAAAHINKLTTCDR